MKQHRPASKQKPPFFYFLTYLSYFFCLLFAVAIIVAVAVSFRNLLSPPQSGNAFASLFRFTGHLALIVGIGVLYVTSEKHCERYAQRHNIYPYDSRNSFPPSHFTDVPDGYIFGTALSLSIFLFYFGAHLVSS